MIPDFFMNHSRDVFECDNNNRANGVGLQDLELSKKLIFDISQIHRPLELQRCTFKILCLSLKILLYSLYLSSCSVYNFFETVNIGYNSYEDLSYKI